MIIGIDFDNTIVCYDNSFKKIIDKNSSIPNNILPVKDDVRNYLRKQGKENEWIVMQGYIYGPGILNAEPFPGVIDFFMHCKKNNIKVNIISHKTLNPFKGPKYDLHKFTHKWLEKQGFYNSEKIGLPRENVFFELTKEEKLNRILRQGCTHYIDDLPELLSEPNFPKNVRKFLFDPNGKYNGNELEIIKSWNGMIEKLK